MQVSITYLYLAWFLGYKDNDYKVKQLCTILPKMTTCVRSYDGETKWTTFLIEDDKLSKFDKFIWNKFSNILIKNLTANLSILLKKHFFENQNKFLQ